MRFSIWPSSAHPWHDLLSLATRAEQAGWDGLWVADHFMPGPPFDADGPQLECFAALAGLAVSVPRVRLGSLVAGNTYRHPAILANQAATIDRQCDGRFVLGLGAGWQEGEHEAYGIELYAPGQRLDRLEEAAQVVRALRDEPRASFTGSAYQLTEAPCEPKPIGPMPLLIGGSGERRTPGIVARWADEWNVWGDPERFAHKSAVITEACVAHGRDPSSLRRSTQALVFIGPDGAEQAAGMNPFQPSIGGTPAKLLDVVAAYEAAGVDELIVPDFHLRSLDQSAELWDTFIEQVAGPYRAA